MRSIGVHRLVVFGDRLRGLPPPADTLVEHEQLQVFSAHVPDQGNHLVSLGQKLAVEALGPLCDGLAYDGPPELLSMWLCLFQAGWQDSHAVGLPDHTIQLCELEVACRCSHSRRDSHIEWQGVGDDLVTLMGQRGRLAEQLSGPYSPTKKPCQPVRTEESTSVASQVWVSGLARLPSEPELAAGHLARR